jgi:hypothetical protein
MATWPASLPQTPNSSGFKDEPIDQAIHTQMETGPGKSRRRYTTTRSKVECSLWITSAQYTTLEAFYNTTLNGGVDTFTWVNFIDSSAATMRFLKPPSYSNLGADQFPVKLSMERTA